MSIHAGLKNQLKDAMRARDMDRLAAIRAMLAAFTNELVAKMNKPGQELPDDEAPGVIRRLVRQRKDSIGQFRKGGREELAQVEEKEMKILETFLPAQMSEEEIKRIAEAVKQKFGVIDKTKLGQLIGAVLKETKGKADGGAVKKIVESLFE